MIQIEENCKGCSVSVRISQKEIERILAEYFANTQEAATDDATYRKRLAICRQCPDIFFGTTCRHCGCLVAIRAKIAEKTCPGPSDKWLKTGEP